MDINRYIEHTNLKPDLNEAQIDQLVAEAIKHEFVGVCIPPFWVERAAREIGNADVQVVTVIGFPLGYNRTETKLVEMEKALADGADELDMVMNISAFKSGMPWTKIELAKCAKFAHEHDAMLKVIIETAYLSDKEIVEACKMVSDAGADFIKTSTGFASSGAKVEHIKLMRTNSPSNVGVKASGGIRDYTTAKTMIEAGADRLGVSAGLEIMKEFNSLN
jgi:deoxyribose-phosphate aldolase